MNLNEHQKVIRSVVNLVEYSIDQLLLHSYDLDRITITYFNNIFQPVAMLTPLNFDCNTRHTK